MINEQLKIVNFIRYIAKFDTLRSELRIRYIAKRSAHSIYCETICVSSRIQSTLRAADDSPDMVSTAKHKSSHAFALSVSVRSRYAG